MSLNQIIKDAAARGADIDEEDIDEDRHGKLVAAIEGAICEAIGKAGHELGGFTADEVNAAMEEVANCGCWK